MAILVYDKKHAYWMEYRRVERIKFFTKDEFNRLIKAILDDKNNPRQLRNLVMILVGEYLALRASEICTIRKSDYNPQLKEMYCIRGKDSNNNTLTITNTYIVGKIEEYLETDPLVKRSIYFFPTPLDPMNPIERHTVTRIIKGYCMQANITNKELWKAHTLKHTRGQYLADKGCDLKEVQFWLGHKNSKNTEIYFQFSAQQQQNMYRKLVGNNVEGQNEDYYF